MSIHILVVLLYLQHALMVNECPHICPTCMDDNIGFAPSEYRTDTTEYPVSTGTGAVHVPVHLPVPARPGVSRIISVM